MTAKDIALIGKIVYSEHYPLPLASANGRDADKKTVRALVFIKGKTLFRKE